MRLGARIGQLIYRFAVRKERLMLRPVVEVQAVDVVDERLRRRAFRKDQRMVVEFDVIILKPAVALRR